MDPRHLNFSNPNPTTTTTNQNPNPNPNPNDNDNDNERSLLSSFLSFLTPTSPPTPRTGLHRPPFDYLCHVCLGLMSNPVTLPSFYHNSFHPLCLDAYHHINPFPNRTFYPLPNQTLKNQINQWCQSRNRLPPPPITGSQAQQAARVFHLQTTTNNNQQQQQQPRVPVNNPTNRSHLEQILMNLRDSRTIVRQNALTGLAEYTNPSNRIYVCNSLILDVVLFMFFSHSPSTTAAAVSLLLNLSTDTSTRHMIAQHALAGLVSCLVDVVADRRPGFSTPIAQDEAAVALYNLTLDVRNKSIMGLTIGLLSGLFNYWLREGTMASRDGRQRAGLAVKILVTASAENLGRLMRDEGRVVERVLEMARRNEEGIEMVRKPAFLLLGEIVGAKLKALRTTMVMIPVMEEMVRMLVKREVEGWCLEVMWKMCGGMKGWEFKEVATLAGAEVVLSEMREKWGGKGLGMAEEMLKVMRMEYIKKSEIARPVNVLEPVVEEEEEGGSVGGHVEASTSNS